MNRLTQYNKCQILENPQNQQCLNILILNKTQQLPQKRLLKRTNDIKARSLSKGRKSIHQSQIENISKFYVKNVFKNGSIISQPSTKIHNSNNQQINEGCKINRFRTVQMKVLGLQLCNNNFNQIIAQGINQSFNQFTNDSINTSNQQLLKIKELKQQLCYQEKVKQSLIVQNQQLRQKISDMQKASFNQNGKHKLLKIQKQNEYLKNQLRLLKSTQNQKNTNLSLKKAYQRIKQLEKQIEIKKKELAAAIEGLQTLRNQYHMQQQQRIAKIHKVEQINTKYKELVNRFQSLTNQKEQCQQSNLEIRAELASFKKQQNKVKIGQ